MTVKWNPLLPDKTRSGGWGSSFNAIKEHLKMTPWSRALTLILRSQLSKKLCICGMYRTSLHWSSAWESERKQTCHYLTTRSRKIMEGSRTHTRAQTCQNEREIHGRKNPSHLSLGEKNKLYKSFVVPAAIFSPSLSAVLWVLCKAHFCSLAFDFRRAFWTIP